MDPRFLRMLTAYEDRRFAWHPGVDPLALARAVSQWAALGTVVSGASTLTMQAARLLEPRPRTFRAKLLQMLRALQLEAHLSKEAILQLYLTLAPYGSNLEGIRAASLAWLGKEPARLTDAEAALLVVLPQAPARLQPDRHPKRARAARDKVLQRAAVRGVLTHREARRAMFDDRTALAAAPAIPRRAPRRPSVRRPPRTHGAHDSGQRSSDPGRGPGRGSRGQGRTQGGRGRAGGGSPGRHGGAGLGGQPGLPLAAAAWGGGHGTGDTLAGLDPEALRLWLGLRPGARPSQHAGVRRVSSASETMSRTTSTAAIAAR